MRLRELAQQSGPGADSRDLAAFISLALSVIAETIEVSVAAWEKRDYWVKADKFRMEWMWAGSMAEKMKTAVLSDDWVSIASFLPQIASRFNKVEVSDNHRLGKPWENAYALLALHRKL